MKNRDLVNPEAVSAINQIAAVKDLSLPLSFAIGLNLRAIKDYLAVFEDTKKALIDKHTLKDSDGAPLPQFQKTADGKFVIDEETGKPAPILNSRKLDKPAELDKEFEVLLNEDVDEKAVYIRRIKISKLKDSKGNYLQGLTPQSFSDAAFMFVNDAAGEVDAVCEAKTA